GCGASRGRHVRRGVGARGRRPHARLRSQLGGSGQFAHRALDARALPTRQEPCSRRRIRAETQATEGRSTRATVAAPRRILQELHPAARPAGFRQSGWARAQYGQPLPMSRAGRSPKLERRTHGAQTKELIDMNEARLVATWKVEEEPVASAQATDPDKSEAAAGQYAPSTNTLGDAVKVTLETRRQLEIWG